MTATARPNAPAAAYHAVASVLDRAEPDWWRRPCPSDSAEGRDPFVQVRARGADGIDTYWMLWPEQARALRPLTGTPMQITVVSERGAK